MVEILDKKIAQLGPIAKKLANKLKKLEIETVSDLIFYYPFRYEDFGRLAAISDVKAGEEITVIGRIEMIASRRSHRQRKVMTEALLTDDSGSIKIIWFNQPWILKTLKAGDTLRVYGKVAGDHFSLHFNSPNWEKCEADSHEAAGIMPVYPLTAGITNKQLKFLIKQALPYSDEIDDFLPADIIAKEKFPSLSDALHQVHFPTENHLLEEAKRRLAYNELFILQIWTKLLRRERDKKRAIEIPFNEEKTKDFVAKLPFALTDDQKRSSWEIIKDMGKTSPMNRLLEGDVGSGKTLVAIIAMYNAALSGAQAVLMAPTEILANQHYASLKKYLGGSGISLGLMTRTQKLFNSEELSKNEFLEKCLDGELKIIVGTHAVIQNEAKFGKLGLVIVDEQHRFGVRQRQSLQEKNLGKQTPHFLSLTATPIPRSLALVLYGDLDLSLIRHLPAGRQPIKTRAVEPQNRPVAYRFIEKQIKAGRQAFVICPLIDPSDKLGVRSVSEEHKKLDQEIYPDIPVGLLHGKLKPEEKDRIMNEFKAGMIKILVATSVVEVGVDVPNATVMMIEGSDRFGLAQLHQFRGRVGRGEHQSYCFLFSDSDQDRVWQRLKFLETCSDGFKLAEFDLKNRGSGSVLGDRQSGYLDSLKVADPTDLELARKARDAAESFVEHFDIADFPELRKKIENMGFISHLE